MKTEDLIRALAQDAPAPAGAASRKALALAASAAVVVLLFVWLGFGLRSDLMGAGATTTLRKLVFTLLLLAAGAHGALALMRPDAHARGALAWLLAPVAAILLLIGLDLASSGATDLGARAVGSSALECVASVTALAVLPLCALLVAMRDGATTSPALAGAFAGLASGALAASFYALHCTEDSSLFVALWYGLAVALTGAAGALAGRRALQW